MPYRAIAALAVVCLALAAGGCIFSSSSSNKDYEEVLMPLQTGSTIQRRVYVPKTPETRTKKKKTEKEKDKEREKSRKPDAEPSATPAAEEESTPAPPDRFR